MAKVRKFDALVIRRGGRRALSGLRMMTPGGAKITATNGLTSNTAASGNVLSAELAAKPTGTKPAIVTTFPHAYGVRAGPNACRAFDLVAFRQTIERMSVVVIASSTSNARHDQRAEICTAYRCPPSPIETIASINGMESA